MRPFSERFGLVPPRVNVQIDSMDDPLRTGLWNALCEHYFTYVAQDPYGYGPRPYYPLEELQPVCRALWVTFFKRSIDTMSRDWNTLHKNFREFFFQAEWNEAYDFVEFVAREFPISGENSKFYSTCNAVLERELSAYRFVAGRLVRVTDQVEVDSIEEAGALPRSLKTVGIHLDAALKHLSDRKAPDYRNSVKESISAVEAVCALITGQDRPEFGSALRVLEERITLHGALRSAFSSLYGYTSDSSGIRHALLNESTLTHDDAKFMLVACSAFVNYVKALAARAKLKL